MQQNVSTAQTPQVVTAAHSQIPPVAHYVSVVAAKADVKVGDAMKPLPHIQHQVTPSSARKALIRCDREINQANGYGVAKPEEHFEKEVQQVATPQHRTQPIHVGTAQVPMYQSSQLQYVNSGNDHVYANGSTTNTFQYSGNNQHYTNSQQQQNNSTGMYFDSSSASQGTTQLTNQSMSGGANHQSIGQIISSPGGSTYLIQGSNNEGGGIVAMPISHATRASPATVQWLMEHFENAEGVSLPRALMYNHYMLHCQEQSLDPVNAASFGKLVRSVFLGLRTRRLGTRGNSKYHYYGIRIKASSHLNRMEEMHLPMRQQPAMHTRRPKPPTAPQEVKTDGQQPSTPSQQTSIEGDQQHQQFLGDATQALPDLDPIQYTSADPPLPEGLSQDDLMVLEDLYRDHCSNMLDVIVNLQFSMIETLWRSFWRADYVADEQSAVKDEYEMKLPRDKLLVLCNWPPVQRWVKDSDHLMFQSLVEVLIPDVLRPIPSALTQAIRNFAKGLEASLSGALTKGEVPVDLVKIKLSAVSAFSQTLRRYTSLNHLAQAARAVLNNVSQINQMLADLNRVDFSNVQEQASWVCQCDDAVVRELESDFKAVLSEQRTLEQWADWLETVVGKILQPHEGAPTFPRAARQFLLKWCFYSSMVIRDLTLRSAQSFGSFHLIRLLFDEYMFYLVEHRVAQATGETAIAVMGDFANIAASHAVMDASPLSPASSAEMSINPSPTFVATAPISSGSVTKQEKGVKRTADGNVKEEKAVGIVTSLANGKAALISGAVLCAKPKDNA